MKISRRELLIATSGIAAGAVMSKEGKGQALDETIRLLDEWSNYEEKFKVSICQQCPGGCGIIGRVMDGGLVKIAGNPLHPVNSGGLCMKGLSGMQVLYDPDRIKTPLKRKGKRGSGTWRPISWDEALNEVSETLLKLREAGQAHTVALLGGQFRGLTDALFQRFAQAYGTPNYLRFHCQRSEKPALSHVFMQGVSHPLCYDLENARTILSFGCNLLESWVSTVHQLKAYGHLRGKTNGNRAHLIQVDCRLSVTAAKADLWVPINPGTDAALALGIAHIIILEELYDRDFITEKTFGFDDWVDADQTNHIGFKSLVLQEYYPQKVSEITSVPVETLFKIARKFAGNKPSLALGEKGTAFPKNDLHTRMAIHSLNALVGNIGVKGGIFIQGKLPLSQWESIEPDEIAQNGLTHPRIDLPKTGRLFLAEDGIQHLPQNILNGKPYELNALLLYYTNPLFSIPNRDEWLKALRKIPFLVSFSPFMDETSSQADLILPDHTYLERWQDDQITHLAGKSVFSLGSPLVEPVYDTRQTEDVILTIAQSFGEEWEEAFSWENYQDLLYQTAEGLYDAERGHIAVFPQQEALKNVITRQGYWSSPYESYDDFWDALVKTGAWWDAHDSYVGARQLLQTPSLKFEFYSQRLKKEMLDLSKQEYRDQYPDEKTGLELAARLLGFSAKDDLMLMPHYEENHSGRNSQNYPFYLNTYKLMSHAGGRGGNQPRLQQHLAVHLESGWQVWVEINPVTANHLHIKNGDWVWLESPKGKIKIKAKLYPGAMPQVLNMPFEQGHLGYGRWAKNRGVNPNSIIENFDDFRGNPVWGKTWVRLFKA
jgi:anaerobic selenocysteine-containing dehydrogenase